MNAYQRPHLLSMSDEEFEREADLRLRELRRAQEAVKAIERVRTYRKYLETVHWEDEGGR